MGSAGGESLLLFSFLLKDVYTIIIVGTDLGTNSYTLIIKPWYLGHQTSVLWSVAITLSLVHRGYRRHHLDFTLQRYDIFAGVYTLRHPSLQNFTFLHDLSQFTLKLVSFNGKVL